MDHFEDSSSIVGAVVGGGAECAELLLSCCVTIKQYNVQAAHIFKITTEMEGACAGKYNVQATHIYNND